MKETVDVISMANGAYFRGLRTTLCSLACFASQTITLRLSFFDDGIPVNEIDELRSLLERLHPDVTLHPIKVSDIAPVDCPKWKGNIMAYMKFLIPKVLPDVHYAIYCDSDFLWCADVKDLWDLRDARYMLQSVKDVSQTIAQEKIWFESEGLPFDEARYFCTGILFMNLDRFRSEHVTEQLFGFVKLHPSLRFGDQTALNSVVGHESNLLDRHWQRLSCDLRGDELFHPCVIHYGGDVPWKRGFWANLLTDPVILWYRFTDSILDLRPGTSLERDFNWWQRRYKRGLVRLLYHPWGRHFFYALCHLTGRGGYCQGFDFFVHDLHICAVMKRMGV